MVTGGGYMKSKIWKSTFREIKQSFGRFMAIFAITGTYKIGLCLGCSGA